jgi:transposase InsO family protein
VKSQDIVPSIRLEEADECEIVSNPNRRTEVDTHKNAPFTAQGRLRMVQAVIEGRSVSSVAQAFRVNRKTVRKWVRRFEEGGREGLRDASCRPRHSPARMAKGTAQRIVSLRRRRWTMAQIASELRISRATVARTLARVGLSRLANLDPPPLAVRYERKHPGDLLHIDTKKLGRILKVGHRITGNPRDSVPGAGWEFAFVCVDDHSRVGFAQMAADERKRTAATFLKSAVAYYRHLGVKVRSVMTDNGPAFHSKVFARTCQALRVRHLFTKPYRPQTNGKAERFIQSALREWAYARAYRHSTERTKNLSHWLHRYNWHRPHAGLAGQVPISRLGLSEENVMRLHT